jgi:hypothetical protein
MPALPERDVARLLVEIIGHVARAVSEPTLPMLVSELEANRLTRDQRGDEQLTPEFAGP